MNKSAWGVWGLVMLAALAVWELWRRGAPQDGPRAVGFDAVSLNRASPEALQSLPGVGPVMAERIIAARPFAAVEDLLRVEGVGAATFRALEPRVRL